MDIIAQRWQLPTWETLRSVSWRAVLWRVLLFGLLGLMLIPVLWLLRIARTLPDVASPTAFLPVQSIVLRDREGRELYRFFENEDRVSLPASAIPDVVRQAFIAIEDERFYDRGCIDVRALGRALLANVSDFKSQGASTITQQLVRTAFLSREKRLERKVREILLACRTEAAYTKDEVLTMYLNWIPFGESVYGIEQASRRYFGVGASDLTLAQAAVLASLPQRPTYFSPYGEHRTSHPAETLAARLAQGQVTRDDQVMEDDVTIGLLPTVVHGSGGSVLLGGRASQVLHKMEELGFIGRADRLTAEADLLAITFRDPVRPRRAPYFALNTYGEIASMISGGEEAMAKGGVNVVTTMDPNLQRTAEELVRKHAERVMKQYDIGNIAMVAADAKTGEILAYVGNTDYFGGGSGSQIDMAQVPRQPGSSFKPLVYAAAFERGLKPNDVLIDAPMEINGDRPQNYEGGFQGPMPAMRALAYSRNIPAIKALQKSDEASVLDLAARLGAVTPQNRKQGWLADGRMDDYGWPLALGAAEVPLIEMVQAYATLANHGRYRPLTAVQSFTDADGRTVVTGERTGRQVLDSAIADNITAILSEPANRPEGYWRSQTTLPGIDAAIKTGTSNRCLKRDKRGKCVTMLPSDNWALGYTPEFVVGVWMGNADYRPLKAKADGLNAAVPLWKEFLIAAHKQRDAERSRFEGTQAPWFRQHPQPKREDNFKMPDWIPLPRSEVAVFRSERQSRR